MCSAADDKPREVEAILGQRKFGKVTRYLVKWKNCGDSEQTWETKANLRNGEAILKQFRESRRTTKPTRAPRPKRNVTEPIEYVDDCTRSRSGQIVYTVKLADTDGLVRIVSRSISRENREKLIDYLESLIPSE
jgi:hypothetical protein